MFTKNMKHQRFRSGALICVALAFGMIAEAQAAETPEEDRAAIEASYDRTWGASPESPGELHTANAPITAPPLVSSDGDLNSQAPPTTITTTAGAVDGRSVLGQPGTTLFLGQLYGTRNGKLVGCNIEIASGAPNPTRDINYGLGVSCNDNGVTGTGIAHLGETLPTPLRALQTGSFFGIQGSSTSGALPVQYLTQSYRRQFEYQFEQVYAYFTLNIQGLDGTDGWISYPTGPSSDLQCTGLLTRRVTCAIASTPFAFAPENANCASGDVCGSPDVFDPYIEQLLAAGVSAADLYDTIAGPVVESTSVTATAALFGLGIPSIKTVKCAAAIIGFVAGNALLVGKIVKAGGFIKVAKRIIKARDTEAALKAVLGAAAEFTGADSVISACA